VVALKHRIISCAVCFLLLFGGCGNYHELNEFDIVAGMAIDSTEDGYKVTLELVNKEGSMQEGLSSNIITLESETVPAALASSNARFNKQFQFGNMQVIVISEDIARDEGIMELLNNFLRDYSIRETILLLVATGESAEETLCAKGIDTAIASFVLEEIIRPPGKTNSHTKEISIYSALDTLNTPGKTLVLPCVQTWQDEEKTTYVEISGLAAFSGDRLQMLLPQRETPFYLYAIGQLQTHEFTFTLPESREQISIQVTKSDTKRSFYESENAIVFRFDITASGKLTHTPPGIDITKLKEKSAIEQAASEALNNSVSDLLTACLEECGLDIADMQYDIYLWNRSLWEKLDRTPENLLNIVIDVNAQIEISSSGNIRNT